MQATKIMKNTGKAVFNTIIYTSCALLITGIMDSCSAPRHGVIMGGKADLPKSYGAIPMNQKAKKAESQRTLILGQKFKKAGGKHERSGVIHGQKNPTTNEGCRNNNDGEFQKNNSKAIENGGHCAGQDLSGGRK